MKFVIGICFGICLAGMIPGHAFGMIEINEILADPASGSAGDANHDGVTSSTQDEFVELVNWGSERIDMSGWWIEDLVGIRAMISESVMLQPFECLLIFGGGNPTGFSVPALIASSGSLGLNNGGDHIYLYDAVGTLITDVSYGSEGGKDQSLTRYPDGFGAFVLHTTIPEAGGALFSPGLQVNGDPFSAPIVPEPASLALLGFGLVGSCFMNQKKRR